MRADREESNVWLLEKVRGPRRAMMETYKALEDAHTMLTRCYVENGDATVSIFFPLFLRFPQGLSSLF